jgi:glycogen operon protein
MRNPPARMEPGSPTPLGAHWDGLGVNFAVFSAHAEEIELCIFDAGGRHETARYTLPEWTDEVWHGYLPGARPGLLYGYRAHGPYEPEQGHRFNPNKLLLDPYARALAGELSWTDALWGYRVHSPRKDLSFDRRDSAAAMPKGVVTADHFHWGADRPPRVPWTQTVIYEAHVRGLSMLRTGISGLHRGTFAALTDPRLIDHLVKLGVTTLELLPVHAFVDDRFLVEKKLRNYWGYNTLSFFAPEQRYVAEGGLDDIRAAVRQLHAANIEVILDVVYNHTCEGNELGPTLSFRGLDNVSYYRAVAGNGRHYVNDTGCGNTLNMSHPRVLQMVMDSLRHWATSYHVDGFRFDLSTTLGRDGEGGFDPGSGFFDALRQDPLLSQLKLIAEPWDLGLGGYQLGNHPPGFAEWNDRCRDDLRRFWRGDGGSIGALAARLAGSSEIFDRRGRRPWASVNFITAHDGFTLHDLVSYDHKHNEANGEDNRDGNDNNLSRNWGHEGPCEDATVAATRERVKRAMLTTLILAHGTPMLVAGDEFGRSQRGNNNAYCQDNDLSWIDWSQMQRPENRHLYQFVSRLIGIRKDFVPLCGSNFPHGREQVLDGVADIGWFDEHGEPMTPDAWGNPERRTLSLRCAGRDAAGTARALLLAVNGGNESMEFTMPQPALKWRLLSDSASLGGAESSGAEVTGRVTVSAHGAVVLSALIDGAAP